MVAQWRHMAFKSISVNTGSDNYWLPDDTKPLPEQVPTDNP